MEVLYEMVFMCSFMLKVHNVDGHLFHLDVELLITHDESHMIEKMTHNCRRSTGVLFLSNVTNDDTCYQHDFF